MRLKFFAVPALDPTEAELAVNAFLAQHRVLAIDRQLVIAEGGACWALCVSYLDSAGTGAPAGKQGKVDYRELLPPEDFEVFAELRRLRKSLAERDGVPPYALLTNEQLAAMVQQRAHSLAELGQLAGIGPARVAKYGPAFIDKLRELQAAQPVSESADAPKNDDPPG